MFYIYKGGTSKLCELGVEADEGAGTQDSYKIRAKMLQSLYLYAYRIYVHIGYTHTFLVKDRICIYFKGLCSGILGLSMLY